MKFLYRIVTVWGSKQDVEASSAIEACSLAGISIEDCKKWYPMALYRIITEKEKQEQRAQLDKVRNNPVYQEHSKQKARVKRRVKI